VQADEYSNLQLNGGEELKIGNRSRSTACLPALSPTQEEFQRVKDGQFAGGPGIARRSSHNGLKGGELGRGMAASYENFGLHRPVRSRR
jgi:hypothetical protein